MSNAAQRLQLKNKLRKQLDYGFKCLFSNKLNYMSLVSTIESLTALRFIRQHITDKYKKIIIGYSHDKKSITDVKIIKHKLDKYLLNNDIGFIPINRRSYY